jgi:hypothetical protein
MVSDSDAPAPTGALRGDAARIEKSLTSRNRARYSGVTGTRIGAGAGRGPIPSNRLESILTITPGAHAAVEQGSTQNPRIILARAF